MNEIGLSISTEEASYINKREFLFEPHPKIIEIDRFTQQWLNKNKYKLINIDSKTSIVKHINEIKSDIKSGKEKLSRKHAHIFKIIQYKNKFLTFDAFDKLLPLKAEANDVKYYNEKIYCPFIWIDGYWHNITKLPDVVKLTEAEFFVQNNQSSYSLLSTKIVVCPRMPLHKTIKNRSYNTDTITHYGFIYDNSIKSLVRIGEDDITVDPTALSKILQLDKDLSNITIKLSGTLPLGIICSNTTQLPKLIDCAHNNIVFYKPKFSTFPNIENGSVNINRSKTLTHFTQSINLENLVLQYVPNVHQLPHNSIVKELHMTNMSNVTIPNSFQVTNIVLANINGCLLPAIDIRYLFIDKGKNITIPSGIRIKELEIDKPIYFIPEDTKVDKIILNGDKITQTKYYELFNRVKRK